MKHHYIPVFYTKRWAAADGTIQVFYRINGRHLTKRMHPDATGYVRDLYALKGFPPNLAHQVEQKFFGSVDNGASEVLALMERFGDEVRWTGPRRQAWARFILTLMTRCPEDVEEMRRSWLAIVSRPDAAHEKIFQAAKKTDTPETLFEKIMALPLHVREREFFTTYMRLMDNEAAGRVIMKMDWHIIDVSDADHALLTSDRPVVHSRGFGYAGGFIGIPVGPRLLFIGLTPPAIFNCRNRRDRAELVKHFNRNVAGGAVRFVYGLNSSEAGFIQKHFGKHPRPRLTDALRRREQR